MSTSNAFTTRKGELNFFIIWEHGRNKETKILEDISKHFEILGCFDILWSPKQARNNFQRLYGAKAGIRVRGTGRFLLIAVWDNNPVYELAETAFTGFEVCNTKMLELKKRYRSWSDKKGVNIVHSSINQKEVNWSLTLLLGKNIADFLASVKTPWDGSFVKMEQDLPGANGWNSLEEVFYILNNTVNYVVLRNFEELPHRFDPSIHGDIDLLTDNHAKLLLILNPPGVSRRHTPIGVTVNVGGQQVKWDIRHVGDDYYCRQWEQDMMQDRVLNSENVYVMNNEHHFYSLVYHALLHKKRIATDYYTKTERLVNSLPLAPPQESFPHIFDYYFDLLGKFMQRRNYEFCFCPTARCNRMITKLHRIAEHLEQKFGLSRVKPIQVVTRAGFGDWDRARTYYQAWLNGKKIFIKYSEFVKHSGHKKLFRKEYTVGNRLYKTNAANFPEALFYSEVKRDYCLATDFLEGEMLEDKIQSSDLSASEKKNVILQLKEIAKSLVESGIVHRDMHLGNFVLAKDGKLKLTDFSHAIRSQNHGEDMDQLLEILEAIGCQKDYQETYREVESFMKEHLGKKSLRQILRQKYRQLRRLNFFKMLHKFERQSMRPFFHRLKQIGRKALP